MNPFALSYCPSYSYAPKYWLVHDQNASKIYSSQDEQQKHKSMLFHISAGDYMTTLATILRFFEETIHNTKTTPEMRMLQLKAMKNIREDLLYMDKHYKIVAKSE
jgi:hypothetical protein